MLSQKTSALYASHRPPLETMMGLMLQSFHHGPGRNDNPAAAAGVEIEIIAVGP